jgi:uncharacterized protein
MARDPNRIRRLPERSVENVTVIHSILDEGFVCHVAFVQDDHPVIIPTLYVRDGEQILLHGSTSAGFVRAAREGSSLSVAVTHVDGLVVARSGFHSSANYRSVVIHGRGVVLSDADHRHALDLIVNGLIPGRLSEIRTSTDLEVRQTATVSIPLDETTAKIRTGPPEDEPADLGTDVWAGVVPLRLTAGVPVPDMGVSSPLPDSVNPYSRPGWE